MIPHQKGKDPWRFHYVKTMNIKEKEASKKWRGCVVLLFENIKPQGKSLGNP